MRVGKFITIEGVEGVGKSTNLEHMQTLFNDRGISFIVTREPGGTAVGEKIRELLLAVSEEVIDATAELLLIFAARAQHIEQIIKPALAKGICVLCDRFTDATYAYQGAGRGIDYSVISALESLVQNELRPDLTLILDLDPVLGMQRARHRGELDRFEREQIEFFQRVRAGYLAIADREPQRCAIIDASLPLEQVKVALTKIICERLQL